MVWRFRKFFSNAQFSKNLDNYGCWSANISEEQVRKRDEVPSKEYQDLIANSEIIRSCNKLEGKNIGFFTEFPTKENEKITLKVGISFTDMDGAEKNFKKELQNKNFDQIKNEARNLWNKALSKISVEGGTEDQKTIFYTALYHTMIDPRDISDVDNILVTELTSMSDIPIDLTATLWAKADNDSYPINVLLTEEDVSVSRSTPNNYRSIITSHTSKVTMKAKVLGVDFETKTGKKDVELDMDFTLEPEQIIYLVTAIGGGGRTYSYNNVLLTTDPSEQTSSLLSQFSTTEDIQNSLASHQDWWKDYWTRSYIKFDATDPKLDTLMKYYYASQYVLACNIREGKVAPGLYGLWHVTDHSSWSSDYHLNYNFISTFYGVNSSNRPEQIRPAIDAILQYVAQGKRNASTPSELRRVRTDFVNEKISKGDISRQNGIPNAILYPVGIGPWGMTLDNNYLSEILNATFSAYPMLEYYNYTQDETFLPTVYDYLKLCVALYETWLEKENGKYILYAGYNEGSWAINPAVELSVLKNALTYLISFSEKLDLDADKRILWQNILSNLAPQPTAKYQGKKVYTLAEKEWKNNIWTTMSNPIPWDGNIIPMESVIPGEQLGYYSPKEELDVAKNTIDVFSNIGGWEQINNFPKIYSIASNTRYPAQSIIDNLAKTIDKQMRKNLLIEDGIHGVEKAGGIEGINNMLLLSDQNVIKVFPNWPAKYDAKFVNLREKGAFVISSEYDSESKEVQYIQIFSEAGKPVTIASPWTEGLKVTDEEGSEIPITKQTAPNWPDEITCTFKTQTGMSYNITKSNSFGTNIEMPQQSDIKIYPNSINPGEFVFVDAGSNIVNNVSVFSTDGRLVKTCIVNDPVSSIKIDDKSGMYFLTLYLSDGLKSTYKIIVK